MRQLLNLFDYEKAVHAQLSTAAYGYYIGGADDEVTLEENRTAWRSVKLAPRVLNDVSERDLSTTIMGEKLSAPIIVAPMALMKLAHAAGEEAVARATSKLGIGMTLSTLSTTALEHVIQQTTAPMWFQLYVYRDRALTRSLVQRAEDAGYKALVLTVDAPIAGNRERDVRNQFQLPEGIELANLSDYALSNMDNVQDQSAIAAYAAAQLDDALTWDDLDWLSSITELPILVKGILRLDDARRAREHGAVGIIISNHGGRQLDTTPATVNVLQRFSDEGGFEGELLVDGGIRRGTDILKAIALGASGVMIGRPILWGLAVNGETGAAHVLEILMEEFDRAMALCGCTSVTDIDHSLFF